MWGADLVFLLFISMRVQEWDLRQMCAGYTQKSAVKICNNVSNSVLAIAPVIKTSDRVTGWHLKSDKQPSLCHLRGAKKKKKK